MSNFNVTFHHPIQDDVLVFIRSEIPHLIKNIVTVFERSGTVKYTYFHFRSHPVSLKLLQQLWLCEQE